MYLLSLQISVVLQQRLHMLPACQSPNASDSVHLHHIFQTVPTSVSKDRSLHVCRLDFTSAHLDLAISTDKALCDIDRVTVVLSEAKEDIDIVVCRSFANSLHLSRVDL
jgi:hypothetical protein